MYFFHSVNPNLITEAPACRHNPHSSRKLTYQDVTNAAYIAFQKVFSTDLLQMSLSYGC